MEWLLTLVLAGGLFYGAQHGVTLHVTPFLTRPPVVRHYPFVGYDCPPHIRAALAAHPPSHLDLALFCRRVDQ